MPHAAKRPPHLSPPPTQSPVAERIWSLDELAILHELPYPVFIYSSGVYGRHSLTRYLQVASKKKGIVHDVAAKLEAGL